MTVTEAKEARRPGTAYTCEGCGRDGRAPSEPTFYTCPVCRWVGALHPAREVTRRNLRRAATEWRKAEVAARPYVPLTFDVADLAPSDRLAKHFEENARQDLGVDARYTDHTENWSHFVLPDGSEYAFNWMWTRERLAELADERRVPERPNHLWRVLARLGLR